MRLRISLLLSSWSWETGSSVIGDAGRIKLSCLRLSCTLDPFTVFEERAPPQYEHCQCILSVHNILVECNHLAETRKYIVGRRHVMQSFRIHPNSLGLFLKFTDITVIIIFRTALYTVFYELFYFSTFFFS